MRSSSGGAHSILARDLGEGDGLQRVVAARQLLPTGLRGDGTVGCGFVTAEQRTDFERRNLVLKVAPLVIEGTPGPPNSLSIGEVVETEVAAAVITGEAP